MPTFVRRRNERILGPRYASREGDSGETYYVSMRDRRTLAKFTGASLLSEVTLGGRAGQTVFSDGALVTGAGENAYPQDTAYVCSGDTGTAALYAGRYLGKWPLQANFAASAGFLGTPFAVGFTSGPYTGTEFAAVGVGGASRMASRITVSGADGRAQLGLSGLSLRSTGFTYCAMVYTGGYQAENTLQAYVVLDPASSSAVVNHITMSAAVFPNLSTATSFVDGVTISSGLPFDQIPYGWHHMAMTIDHRVGVQLAKLYIDGVYFGQGGISAVCRTVTGAKVVHRRYLGDSVPLNPSAYRNYRLYSKALTAAEIAAIAIEDAA